MRNGQVHIGVSGWIVYPRMKRAVWLEKLRLKFNLALNVHRADWRSKPHNFVHELLLRRSRKIHARLRTEPRIKEINVMLDSNFLERFPCESVPFLGRGLLVGVKPPPCANKQQHQNDEHN